MSLISHPKLARVETRGALRRGLVILLSLAMLLPASAMAQLTQRFTANDNGNVAQIGNALTTCTGSASDGTTCASARSGGTRSNQDFTIININVDPVGGGAPANSSTANLSLPPGSTVLWAGLYWSGRTATASGDGAGPIAAAARNIWIKAPAGSYGQVTALAADTNTFNTQGSTGARPYSAFYDVTTLVQGAGAGTYSVGGLTTTVGTDTNLGYYGGWALIVAYHDGAQPYRRLTVYNAGNVPVSNGNNQSVTVTGITTPVSGDFDAYMGALVWEGDAGLTGDQFQLTGGDILNPGALSDAESLIGNFWNSRISNLGVLNNARNPAYYNNFGIDLKMVDISHTPANAGKPRLSNSFNPSVGIDATLSFTSSQDVYFPHALVFVTDLFRPEVIPTLLKTAVKVGGSPGPDLHPGDTIEYTISFHNQGRDGAIRVVADDPIPVGLIYVPGSIQITQDDGFPGNVGVKSDAIDGDTAEFDPLASPPRGTLTFRVGAGATGGVPPPPVEGGTLLPTQGVVLKYRATIDPGFGGSTITNVVDITHGSLTFPNDPSQTVSGSVNSDINLTPLPQMLLSKVASPSAIANQAGETSQFTLTVHNYNSTVTNVNVTDTLPANWAFVANSAVITLPGGGTISGVAANPGIGGQLLTWALGQTMAANQTLTITFTAITTAPPGGSSINNATASGIDSASNPVSANGSATVSISDLRINKQANPTTAGVGGTVNYTVTITNAGTGRQNNIVVNDPLPPGVTYVNQSTVANGFQGASADYFDQFSGIAFNGSNGSINWTPSPWNETDSGGAGTGNGNIRVVNDAGCPAGNCLRIRANNTNDTVYREANLSVPACSSASSIVLSYDYNNQLANNRTVSAYLYRGNTQTTLLATYDNGNNTGAGTYTHTLTAAEIGNDTRIRFNATQVGGGTTYLYVDNVRFACAGTTTSIKDNIPAGVNADLISGIPATLVRAGDNFVLDPGQQMSVTYQVTINPGIGFDWYITNTASASSVETPTPVSGSATVHVLVPNPQMSVVKSETSSGPYTLGGTISYSVVMTNTGNVPLTNVVVSDPKLTPNSQVCASVPIAGTCVLSGTHVVTQADVDAGQVVNQATVNSTEVGPTPSNQITIPLAQSASLGLAKTVTSTGPYALGSTIAYQIVATNTGTTTLTNVSISDALLGALTCTPAQPATLAPNATLTCTGSYTVVMADVIAGNVHNQAMASGTDPGSNPVTAPPAEVDTPIAAPSVSVAKTSNPATGTTVTAGQLITYTLTATVTDAALTTNLVLTDTLSAGQSFGSVTVPGAYTANVSGAPTLVFTLPAGTVPGTYAVSYTATVNANASGSVGNSVVATGGGPTPPSCTTCTTTHPLNPNVSVVKALTNESGTVVGIAEPGETLTYTITLSNSGGVSATGVGITDALDPNVGFVSADNGGTFGAGLVTWTGLTVPAGGSLVLTVQTQVVAPIPAGATQIANLAYVTGSTPPACPPSGPQCVVMPTLAELSVVKALSDESNTDDGIAEPGEVLTYTITVSNSGGTAALNTIVNEVVPQNTTFVADAPNIWVGCADGAAAGSACDTIVNVPAQSGVTPGTVSVTFKVRVDDPLAAGVTSIFNAVALNDGTPPDCVALPSSPGCAVVPTSNLRLTKVVDSVTPTGPGRYQVAYRIDVVNLGGTAATYTLTDTFGFTNSGVVFTGNAQVTTIGGTLDPGLVGGQFPPVNGSIVQISASGVSLAVGATHSYTVRVPIGVQPANLQNGTCTGAAGHGLYNEASLTGSANLDSAACAPVTGDVPLIDLVKTVTLGQDFNGDHYGDVGDVLEYHFTISNPGALPLSPVQLFDPRLQSLQCDPTTIGGQPFRVIPGDELFRDEFNGATSGTLVPGDSVQCTGTYTLTAADVARRQVVNTATATGVAPGGQAVSSVSTAIFTMFR